MGAGRTLRYWFYDYDFKSDCGCSSKLGLSIVTVVNHNGSEATGSPFKSSHSSIWQHYEIALNKICYVLICPSGAFCTFCTIHTCSTKSQTRQKFPPAERGNAKLCGTLLKGIEKFVLPTFKINQNHSTETPWGLLLLCSPLKLRITWGHFSRSSFLFLIAHCRWMLTMFCLRCNGSLVHAL